MNPWTVILWTIQNKKKNDEYARTLLVLQGERHS